MMGPILSVFEPLSRMKVVMMAALLMTISLQKQENGILSPHSANSRCFGDCTAGIILNEWDFLDKIVFESRRVDIC